MWHDANVDAGSDNSTDVMATRPPVTSTLFDNITITGTWIDGNYSDPVKNYEMYQRVINNVSLAMPHPGKSVNRSGGMRV